MISNMGATFAPGQTDPTQRPPASPVQQAVQLLSVNMPRVFGAPTPVDPSLLGGVGGVHPAVASAVVRSVLQALFGPSGLPPSLAGNALGAGAPRPSGEAGGLQDAITRGLPGAGPGLGAGGPMAPPQFTFNNPPPAAGPAPGGGLGTTPTPGGGGPLAPPTVPSASQNPIGGLGVGMRPGGGGRLV